MKKIISILAALVLSFSTQATLISIELDNTGYSVGDTLTAQVIISDIEDDLSGFQKLLADFTFTLGYSSSVTSFSSVLFGNKLDVDFFSLIPSDQYFDDSVMNELTVSEFSYADSFDLATAQNSFNSFVLATLSFNVISAGNNYFSINSMTLGDDFSDSFASINLEKSIEFTVTEVPEPASIFLVLMGLSFLVARKKSL